MELKLIDYIPVRSDILSSANQTAGKNYSPQSVNFLLSKLASKYPSRTFTESGFQKYLSIVLLHELKSEIQLHQLSSETSEDLEFFVNKWETIKYKISLSIHNGENIQKAWLNHLSVINNNDKNDVLILQAPHDFFTQYIQNNYFSLISVKNCFISEGIVEVILTTKIPIT